MQNAPSVPREYNHDYCIRCNMRIPSGDTWGARLGLHTTGGQRSCKSIQDLEDAKGALKGVVSLLAKNKNLFEKERGEFIRAGGKITKINRARKLQEIAVELIEKISSIVWRIARDTINKIKQEFIKLGRLGIYCDWEIVFST